MITVCFVWGVCDSRLQPYFAYEAPNGHMATRNGQKRLYRRLRDELNGQKRLFLNGQKLAALERSKAAVATVI